jgi:RED-like protein N-terminal region
MDFADSLQFELILFLCCREEKKEEPEAPKYRDRAKERREDQNPDYEPTELGAFHAVAPPGAIDLGYVVNSI